MPEMTGSSPPLPPDVRAQQSPVAQYAQGAMAAGQQQGGQFDSIQYARKLIAGVSNQMLDLAKVLSVEKPALMPMVKKMAMVGQELEKMLSDESQGQGSPSQGAEPPQSSQTAPEAPGDMGI